MLVIGITGPSGAGKSVLTGAFDYPVIDADYYARRAVESTDVLDKLSSAFGNEIIKSDGTLDRKTLAKKAFADRQKVELLNSITHPAIMKLIENKLHEYKAENAQLVFMDAPQLFEADAQRLCDYVIAVTARREIRKARILARDGISNQAAEERLNVQKPDSYYLERTPYLIENNESVEAAKQNFTRLIRTFLTKEN